MIPSINDARMKARERKEQELLEKEREKNRFEEVREETVNYYCELFESEINDRLGSGEFAIINIAMRHITDHVQGMFRCTTGYDEYVLIMSDISRKLMKEYQNAGYDVSVEKILKSAEYIDAYRLTVSFEY